MHCSGCGAEISAIGSVCPFCGNDKSDDKRYEWVKFVGGIAGIVMGFSIFDSFLSSILCFFPGYIVGVILGTIAFRRKRTSASKITKAVPEPVKPLTQATVAVEDKLAQLKKMHEQGLLTAEEYAGKKAEILSKF